MQGKNQSIKGYAPLKTTDEAKGVSSITSVNISSSSNQDSNNSQDGVPHKRGTQVSESQINISNENSANFNDSNNNI